MANETLVNVVAAYRRLHAATGVGGEQARRNLEAFREQYAEQLRESGIDLDNPRPAARSAGGVTGR